MSASVGIDPDDPAPPYEQLLRQLTGLVEDGTLRGGARLAPVRRLAADLDLAIGTVARAYRELEAAGLVETSRGGGTRVVGPGSFTPDELTTHLDRLARAYVSAARRAGADEQAVRAALERALAAGRRPSAASA